jgi:hypothetical protein
MSDEHTYEHNRVCAQCGKPIPDERAKRVLYCDKVCKRAFHNVSQCRGQEIMAFLEAQRRHCRAKSGKNSEHYEIQKFARQQVAELLADYLRADKLSGRDASLIVRARMEEGVLVMDKRRRQDRPQLSSKPWFMEKEQSA